MIVTVTGANDHLRRHEVARIIADFERDHGAIAIERHDGEEASAERMRESVQSLPFLSARKLVVLREPSKQKAFTEDISDILTSVADSSDVIIYEPKLDKRSTYYKALKKSTDFREFAELDASGLARWIVDYVKSHQGTISSADARLLIDRIGTHQQLVRSEIDKLLAYNPDITKEGIMLLIEPMPQSTIFELLDAAFAQDSERTFRLYGEQRALKIEPQAIIAMLAWQLHIVAIVKTAGERSGEAIAREAKLSPFVVRKTQAIARHISLEQVKKYINDLLELDMRLKRTAIDADEALQLYLLILTKRV